MPYTHIQDFLFTSFPLQGHFHSHTLKQKFPFQFKHLIHFLSDNTFPSWYYCREFTLNFYLRYRDPVARISFLLLTNLFHLIIEVCPPVSINQVKRILLPCNKYSNWNYTLKCVEQGYFYFEWVNKDSTNFQIMLKLNIQFEIRIYK